jgi:hypothetical protein
MGQSRGFWRLRERLRYLQFVVDRSVFGLRRRLADDRRQSSTLFKLSRSTLAQIALSVIIATTLQILGPAFDEFLQVSLLQITSDAYTNLLSSVTATGAVLIGLYYAATTAIAGATYARVPNSVRGLFASDHVGSVYMRFLALLTYTGVVLLALRAAGLPPVRTAIVLLGFGAGVSVIGFVRLGARAFNLFDPTTLLSELVQVVRRSFLQCVAGEFRWNDPSFQNHSSQNAKSAIEIITQLAEITGKEAQLNGEAFVVFCRDLIALLIDYQSFKKKIPLDSRWYPIRYSHPDWYRSDDNSTALAYQTSGRLEPRSVSDFQWIESRIAPIIYTCIRKNFDADRQGVILSLIGYIDAYTQALAAEHEIKGAIDLVEELTDKCEDIIFRKLEPHLSREPLENLALADAVASLQINIFLSYLRAAIPNDIASIDRAVGQLRWANRTEIYQCQLPQYSLTQLEWLYSRVEFECRSEGRRVSPNWYIGELIRQSAVENSKAAFEATVKSARALFEKWLSIAETNGLVWVRATILAREAEYWQKVEYNFHLLKGRWEALNSVKRIEGLPWAKLELDELTGIIGSRKKQIVAQMAEVSEILSASDRPDSYPDFAGQFLHAVGEQLLSAIIRNDVDTVNAIFPAAFAGALRQFDRLSKAIDFSDWRGETASKIAVAPILDAMQLSGYCIVFSELYHNPMLSLNISQTWTKYLDQRLAKSKDILPFFAAAISITESAFELAHRSLIRTSWSQAVAHELRKVERRDTVVGQGTLSHRSEVVHDSPLIRVFARDEMGSFYDGLDVFIERLIRNRPDASKVELSPRRRDLHEALARERRGVADTIGDSPGDQPDE